MGFAQEAGYIHSFIFGHQWTKMNAFSIQMTLSVHSIAGTAVALTLRGNPVVAVIAAFLSHYILDALPHWHYRILSKVREDSAPFGKKMDFGKNFLKDLLRTGLDLALGMAVSLSIAAVISPDNLLLVFFATIASALPDALQVFYFRFPDFKPFYYLQLLHDKAHSKKRFDGEYLKGISQQIILSVIFIAIIIFIT